MLAARWHALHCVGAAQAFCDVLGGNRPAIRPAPAHAVRPSSAAELFVSLVQPAALKHAEVELSSSKGVRFLPGVGEHLLSASTKLRFGLPTPAQLSPACLHLNA